MRKWSEVGWWEWFQMWRVCSKSTGWKITGLLQGWGWGGDDCCCAICCSYCRQIYLNPNYWDELDNEEQT